jgi:hypothetical protein
MRRKSSSSKDQVIAFRVTSERLKLIETHAERANMSRTAYLEAIVNKIHPVEETPMSMEAYRVWFLHSRRWHQGERALRSITERICSVELVPEVMRILVRLHDIAQEALDLVAKLRNMTIDRDGLK